MSVKDYRVVSYAAKQIEFKGKWTNAEKKQVVYSEFGVWADYNDDGFDIWDSSEDGGTGPAPKPIILKNPTPIVTAPAPVNVYDPGNDLNVWKNRIGLQSGRGLAHQHLTNTLMGFNHRIVNNPVPINRDIQGLSFFVRPDLNLSEANVANSRRFSDMASQPHNSVDRAIMAMLDPLCPYTAKDFNYPMLGVGCHPEVPFDNKQAFIPMLSTLLQNFSGLPDNTVDSWMSDEGLMREQWGMVDSTWQVNYGYTASSTFSNMVGDPVMKLISMWLEYAAGIKAGRFMPRIENSIQRRIDYQSRWYNIKFDPLGGKILRFNVACVMWPQNDNAGAMAGHDATKNMTGEDQQLNIQWQCIGARYNDPYYMEAFNATVAMFNSDMIPDPKYMDKFVPLGGDKLVKISTNELKTFNYYGYPHIDSLERTLSWYVERSVYDAVRKEAGL